MKDYMLWLKEIMCQRPKGNMYIDSPRGVEVAKLCLAFEKENYPWRRSDEDTFWIDVQMFVKYKLADNEIIFTMKMQAGVENYKKHSEERKAYAEMMRGIQRLRQIESKKNQEWEMLNRLRDDKSTT